MEKKKKFKLFDSQREGRGIEKGEDTRPTLARFFKLWGRKFWKLISMNLIMLVQIIPIALALFAYQTGPKTPTQYFMMYSPLIGAQTAAPTSAGITLLNTATGMYPIATFNTPVYWIIGGLAVFQIVTYGWQKVGSVYITRNLVRGDGVFIVSDYFYAIKRNLKQGLLLGLLDCACIFALIVDFLYFMSAPSSAMNNFMYAMVIALIIIYLIMRFYTYLMLVTFDMKIRKILKNALIFTALGIKRNLMAILGMAVLLAISIALMIGLAQFGIYVGIILPFLCILSFSAFMYTYAAYPIIQRYMIDPVINKNSDPETAEPAET